jgi:DNA invertase Pin-like site-specific DNA recombinase
VDSQIYQGRLPVSHILGYARVSTDDQDLASQRTRLESAGAFRVFADVISGRTFDRPGLTDLLHHIRPGDTIAVVRLDRLGRSLRELLEVVETLKKRGVALLSLEEKIDTSSAAGELVFHVFGAIAQFERRLIAARQRQQTIRPALDQIGKAERRAHAGERRYVANSSRAANGPWGVNRLSRNSKPSQCLSP